MKERYIEKSIRKNLIKSIILPLLFVGMLIDALLLLNPKSMTKPIDVDNIWEYLEQNKDVSLKGKCINTTFKDLDYTGFDLVKNDSLIGSFYYTVNNTNCILVLINTGSKNSGTYNTIPSGIEEYKMTGKIIKSKSLNTELVNNIAKKISWDDGNLKDNISEYVVSEPDYKLTKILLFAASIKVLLLISILYILYTIVLVINPHLIPNFKILKRYGNKEKHIKRANNELSHNVVEYLNNAYITESYFIDLQKFKPIIIPLKDIDTCKYGSRRNRKSTIYVRMSHGDTYKIYDRTYSDYKKLMNVL